MCQGMWPFCTGHTPERSKTGGTPARSQMEGYSSEVPVPDVEVSGQVPDRRVPQMGVPSPGSSPRWKRSTQPGPRWGGVLLSFLMGYPIWLMGVPIQLTRGYLHLVNRGTPGGNPQDNGGSLHPDLGPGQGGVPQLEQHSIYMLHSGQYASCIHAG